MFDFRSFLINKKEVIKGDVFCNDCLSFSCCYESCKHESNLKKIKSPFNVKYKDIKKAKVLNKNNDCKNFKERDDLVFVTNTYDVCVSLIGQDRPIIIEDVIEYINNDYFFTFFKQDGTNKMLIKTKEILKIETKLKESK